jgi:hypothetical protein
MYSPTRIILDDYLTITLHVDPLRCCEPDDWCSQCKLYIHIYGDCPPPPPYCKGALMMDVIEAFLVISRTFQPHLFNLYSAASVLKFISCLSRLCQRFWTALSRIESKCSSAVWIETCVCTCSSGVWFQQWDLSVLFRQLIVLQCCSLLNHYYLHIWYVS